MITLNEKSLLLVDFHSHILPAFDDGASDLNETKEILDTTAEQGIDVIVATPHFYTYEKNLESYLKKREEAIKSFLEVYDKDKHPKVALGAEVHYFDGIGNATDINKLAIKGTKYILVEMPFSRWNTRMLNDLELLRQKQGLEPILAHVERYLDKQSMSIIKQLRELDFCMQYNAEFLIDQKNTRRIAKLMSKGMIHLMGSDTHNTQDRRQQLGDSIPRILKQKFGEEFLYSASHLSSHILKKAEYITL